MNFAKRLMMGTALAAVLLAPGNAFALSLRDAIQIAVESNPEIGQAIENREATQFELKQALGLYAPRVDLEASTGVQLLSNPSRRAAGIDDDPLYPSEVGLVATYDILDGGYRDSEADRQAARVDGAAFRVLERSEFIGLEIARVYFEIMLQARIVELSRQNLAFHEQTLANVTEAIASGQLTEADRQQVSERMASARAGIIEAQDALEVAKIGFNKLVGVPLENGAVPGRPGSMLPKTLSEAIGLGRENNPRIRIAGADLDAAGALVDQARGALGPKLSLEGRSTVGNDNTGTAGWTTDLTGKLTLRWNIYDGGIGQNRVQEEVRRESEAMLAQQQVAREVEEAVRISWDRIHRQRELAAEYNRQLDASEGLVASYREQFTIGERSLLDVLDAQNTRFNVQVLRETAEYSARFAEYRLLAATGQLLQFVNLAPPAQAEPGARETLDTPASAEGQPRKRKPLDLSAPLDLTGFTN